MLQVSEDEMVKDMSLVTRATAVGPVLVMRGDVPSFVALNVDHYERLEHAEAQSVPVTEEIDMREYPEALRNHLLRSPALVKGILEKRRWLRDRPVSGDTRSLAETFGMPADTPDEILAYDLTQPRVVESSRRLDLF